MSERVVQVGDQRPFGVGGYVRGGVATRDRGLDQVRPPLAAPRRSIEQADSFGDLGLVPARTVLIFQRDQVAGLGHAAGSPGVMEQHEREQRLGLRLIGHQVG